MEPPVALHWYPAAPAVKEQARRRQDASLLGIIAPSCRVTGLCACVCVCVCECLAWRCAVPRHGTFKQCHERVRNGCIPAAAWPRPCTDLRASALCWGHCLAVILRVHVDPAAADVELPPAETVPLSCSHQSQPLSMCLAKLAKTKSARARFAVSQTTRLLLRLG